MQDEHLLGKWQEERPPMPIPFRILLILCLIGFAYLTFNVIKNWNYSPGTTASQEFQAERN